MKMLTATKSLYSDKEGYLNPGYSGIFGNIPAMSHHERSEIMF